MLIPILSPYWGHEHLPVAEFLMKIKMFGYDGIDTWIPTEKKEKNSLKKGLVDHDLILVSHQHKADGTTFKKFCQSYQSELMECAAFEPVQINSHTGRDYFSREKFLTLIDIGDEFTAKSGILIAHETHRGHFGYCPQMIEEFYGLRPFLRITADFSHWTCVTESMLHKFDNILKTSIQRSIGIHARVGFEQGPQITHPRDPVWSYALDRFLGIWDEIIKVNADNNNAILPITTEFGPFPYMMNLPFSGEPLSNQFDVNCFMKDLLKDRYKV